MEELQSLTGFGEPIFMKSDGRQHSSDLWAKTTADVIWITSDLDGEKLASANRVKQEMIRLMSACFDEAVMMERLHLLDPDHCRKPLDPVKIAVDLMMDIQTIKSSEWYDLLKSVEWAEAALQVIGSNLATAQHIERLWFADDHPDNQAAQDYKLQAQGNNKWL